MPEVICEEVSKMSEEENSLPGTGYNQEMVCGVHHYKGKGEFGRCYLLDACKVTK